MNQKLIVLGHSMLAAIIMHHYVIAMEHIEHSLPCHEETANEFVKFSQVWFLTAFRIDTNKVYMRCEH